jgi:hypothetical protein
MKRPTITKRQAVEAMIEQAKRDYHTAHGEHHTKVKEAELHLHMLVRDLVQDPVQLAALTLATPVDLGGEAEDDEDKLDQVLANVELRQAGRYRNRAPLELVIQINDPEIRAAQERLTKLRRSYPSPINEGQMFEFLDAKLTGCDPQSLLSVPENVATIRALLNGLVLLPQH